VRVFTIACALQPWHEAEGRSCVHSAAGAPQSLRTRGLADKPRGSSKKRRRQEEEGIGEVETDKGKKRKKPRSRKDAASHKHKGYEGDAAMKKIRKFGANEGWIVETYPKTRFEHERWFMKVLDGSSYVSEDGETTKKKLIWMEQGSVTKLAKGYQPKALGIERSRLMEKHNFLISNKN
jgi:hypothetical protein